MNVPKTVIIGATGFIGSYFHNFHKDLYQNSLGTSYRSTDIGKNNIIAFDMQDPDLHKLNLHKQNYEHVLILAGISKIGFCEDNKELTQKINVKGTLEIVRQAKEEGLFPIYTSSDAIFSGYEKGNYTEDSPPSPVNEYGRQKAEVESEIPKICGDNYLILRLSKIFSMVKGDNTMLDEFANKLLHSEKLIEAYDNIVCPMLIDDLVKTVAMLQEKKITGVINVCGKEAWSRYDLAVALAKKMNISTDKIVKESIDKIVTNSKRSHNTSMLINRLESLGKFPQTSLELCLQVKAEQWKI